MSLQYTEESPRLRPAGAAIHITDIEAAINWWRERKPSDGVNACAEVRALAEVYGLMVYHREPDCDEATMPGAAREAWLGWYASTPDTPCIAICSTSQGDAVCKGCGRSFAEVQGWPEMSPAEKRATWRRITHEGSAWRFNRYAERAGGASPAPGESAAPAPAPAPAPAAPAPAPAPMLQQPPEPQAVVAVAPQPHVPPESPAEPVQVSMPHQAPAQAEPPAEPGVPSLPEPDVPPRQAEPLPSLPAEPQPPASLPEPAPLAVAGKAARTAKPVPHPNAARQGQAKRKRARRRKG